MQYGMVIDAELCVGCNACAVACKINNNLPAQVWWNSVIGDDGVPSGLFPDGVNIAGLFIPKACQHCRKPACVQKCPTGASRKTDDGTVIVDAGVCIGCAACIEACPYDVRTIMQDEPTYYQEVALGQWDAPDHRAGKAEKCTPCANVRARGMEPPCIKACNMHARMFGDLDDPESAVSRVLSSGNREYARLLEEEGTEPCVYYLV